MVERQRVYRYGGNVVDLADKINFPCKVSFIHFESKNWQKIHILSTFYSGELREISIVMKLERWSLLFELRNIVENDLTYKL